MTSPDRSELVAYLEKLSITRQLARSDVIRLAGSGSFSQYKRGRMLFYQDDPAAFSYLLLQGSVSRSKFRSDETSLNIGTAGPEDWIGLAEVVLECPYQHSALAAEATSVLGFTRRQVIRFLDSPPLAQYLLSVLALDSYMLHTKIRMNKPRVMIAEFLLSNITPQMPRLEITQDTIAQELGLARETVNRHLNALDASESIRIGRGNIKILDRSALVDLVEAFD